MNPPVVCVSAHPSLCWSWCVPYCSCVWALSVKECHPRKPAPPAVSCRSAAAGFHACSCLWESHHLRALQHNETGSFYSPACHRELWVKLLFTVQGSSCAYLTVLPGSIGSFIGENGYIASMKHTPQNRSSISYTIYFVWQGGLVFKTACRSVCFQCNRTV